MQFVKEQQPKRVRDIFTQTFFWLFVIKSQKIVEWLEDWGEECLFFCISKNVTIKKKQTGRKYQSMYAFRHQHVLHTIFALRGILLKRCYIVYACCCLLAIFSLTFLHWEKRPFDTYTHTHTMRTNKDRFLLNFFQSANSIHVHIRFCSEYHINIVVYYAHFVQITASHHHSPSPFVWSVGRSVGFVFVQNSIYKHSTKSRENEAIPANRQRIRH